MTWKFGRSYNLFYFQERESRLNIPTPTPLQWVSNSIPTFFGISDLIKFGIYDPLLIAEILLNIQGKYQRISTTLLFVEILEPANLILL